MDFKHEMFKIMLPRCERDIIETNPEDRKRAIESRENDREQVKMFALAHGSTLNEGDKATLVRLFPELKERLYPKPVSKKTVTEEELVT